MILIVKYDHLFFNQTYSSLCSTLTRYKTNHFNRWRHWLYLIKILFRFGSINIYNSVTPLSNKCHWTMIDRKSFPDFSLLEWESMPYVDHYYATYSPFCYTGIDSCACTTSRCPVNSQCYDTVINGHVTHDCVCDECWEGPYCNIKKRTCACENPCGQSCE